MIYFHGEEVRSKLPRMKAYIENYLPWINETINIATNLTRSTRAGSSNCMYGGWVSRQVMGEGDYCLLKHLLR